MEKGFMEPHCGTTSAWESTPTWGTTGSVGDEFFSWFIQRYIFNQEFARVGSPLAQHFVSVTRQGFPRAVENMPAAIAASYTHILGYYVGRP